MAIESVGGTESLAAQAAARRREAAEDEAAKEARARDSESSGQATPNENRTEGREDNLLRASLGDDRGSHLDIQA